MSTVIAQRDEVFYSGLERGHIPCQTFLQDVEVVGQSFGKKRVGQIVDDPRLGHS